MKAWILLLPLGLGLALSSVGIAFAVGAGLLAFGLWTFFPAFASFFPKGNLRTRGRFALLAAAGRTVLAAALLALLIVKGRPLLLTEDLTDVVLMSFGFLVYALSAAFAFYVAPRELGDWKRQRGFDARLATETVRPGETVTAFVETGKRLDGLSGVLGFSDSATDNAGKKNPVRTFPAQVTGVSQRPDGVWTATLSVRVPDDAAPTLDDETPDDGGEKTEDEKENPSWAFWELDILDGDRHMTVLDLRVSGPSRPPL